MRVFQIIGCYELRLVKKRNKNMQKVAVSSATKGGAKGTLFSPLAKSLRKFNHTV